MAEWKEPCEPPALGFIRVHRKTLEVAAARMRDVIRTADDCAPRPLIVEIERQRRIDWNRRMQARGWLPRAITNTGDEFAGRAGRREWHATAVARDEVTAVRQAPDLDL